MLERKREIIESVQEVCQTSIAILCPTMLLSRTDISDNGALMKRQPTCQVPLISIITLAFEFRLV